MGSAAWLDLCVRLLIHKISCKCRDSWNRKLSSSRLVWYSQLQRLYCIDRWICRKVWKMCSKSMSPQCWHLSADIPFHLMVSVMAMMKWINYTARPVTLTDLTEVDKGIPKEGIFFFLCNMSLINFWRKELKIWRIWKYHGPLTALKYICIAFAATGIPHFAYCRQAFAVNLKLVWSYFDIAPSLPQPVTPHIFFSLIRNNHCSNFFFTHNARTLILKPCSFINCNVLRPLSGILHGESLKKLIPTLHPLFSLIPYSAEYPLGSSLARLSGETAGAACRRQSREL